MLTINGNINTIGEYGPGSAVVKLRCIYKSQECQLRVSLISTDPSLVIFTVIPPFYIPWKRCSTQVRSVFSRHMFSLT
jgi:hypothetical protein